MHFVARIIYRFVVVPVSLILIHLIGLFNKKIYKAISGRYQAISILKNVKSTKPIIMFHASSLGEFEHIRPLIYRLGEHYKIIVTFFSPSGFDHAKKTWNDELHTYLPFDIFSLWKKFFRHLRPNILIMSKHDVWPSQVLAAKSLEIPIFLVNASLAEQSTRLNLFYRFILSEAYKAMTAIFTVSEEDRQRFLKYFHVNNVKTIGDTKFDQVLIRKEQAQQKVLLDKSWLSDKVLVLGSIWPEDYKVLRDGLLQLMTKKDKIRLIMVPHQPVDSFVHQILNDFENFGAQKFSNKKDFQNKRVLVVDVVGVLADLYKYASWAYVGGSFKQGIHNVMEAAAYGIPVMFGPVHQNSSEALELVQQNGALVIDSSENFKKTMERLIADEAFTKKMGQMAQNFVLSKTGATRLLLKEWQSLEIIKI